jgi:hypothetical protein
MTHLTFPAALALEILGWVTILWLFKPSLFKKSTYVRSEKQF